MPSLDGDPCPKARDVEQHGNDAAAEYGEKLTEHDLVTRDRRQQQGLQCAALLFAGAKMDGRIDHAHETECDEKVREHPANVVAKNFADIAGSLFREVYRLKHRPAFAAGGHAQLDQPRLGQFPVVLIDHVFDAALHPAAGRGVVVVQLDGRLRFFREPRRCLFRDHDPEIDFIRANGGDQFFLRLDGSLFEPLGFSKGLGQVGGVFLAENHVLQHLGLRLLLLFHHEADQ